MITQTRVYDVRILSVEDPGIPVSPPVDVDVADGRIVSITPSVGARPGGIDGGGQFLLPGLINSHDHLYSKELRSPTAGNDLRTMRRLIDRRDEALTAAVMIRNAWEEMAQGVLVVRDLGARHGLNTHVAGIFDRRILPGPVVVACGRPIVMTGGHVSTFGREADGPAECRKAVREQRRAGARVIKIMASGGLSNFPHESFDVPEYTGEELSAITAEARGLGLPTCAHAFGADAVEAAVGAGVDCIEHPLAVVGSDGNAIPIDQPEARPHPRNFGTFPRILGRYAREKGLLSLEEAVLKMSAEPARRLGLTDRGVVREGAIADLVVFDPETVADTTDFGEAPTAPIGIDTVVVSGTVVVDDGVISSDRPGRVLLGG